MKRWGDIFSGAGTIALSLLACASCPACIPLYAGLLSVIGGLLGFELVDTHLFLFPLVITLSLFTLGFMAYQIRTHHGLWTPFKLAIGAVGGIMLAAFLEHEYLLYGFSFLFMGSILWNKRALHTHHEHNKCC
jgi:hypothetical protein